MFRNPVFAGLVMAAALSSTGVRPGPLFMLAGTSLGGRGGPGALTEANRAAIRTIDTAFVHAWLRDDTTGVLRLFSPGAILLPPGGTPVEGLAAIRAYWWPTDGSHTRITAFTRDVAELAGSPELAYMRGVASLTWVTSKDGKETPPQSSHSTDLTLLTRDCVGGGASSGRCGTSCHGEETVGRR